MGMADQRVFRYYDTTAPRYTSYPPATCFHDGFGSVDYQRALDACRDRDGPISLYVHIPFCYQQCYYCACNRVVSRRRERAEGYLRWLLQEIRMLGERLGGSRSVCQMHWGGGTPTYLNAGQLTELMHGLTRAFPLSSDAGREYSIELDPRETEEDTLALLRGLGFNRISIGVQDFDADVQRAINRIQPESVTARVVDAARRYGFESINFDLIYGLPRQTIDGFVRSLQRAVQLGPERLSIFNYAHLPSRFPAQRMINATELPRPGEKLRMLETAIEVLTGAGYLYIGMDHFALPDDPLAQAQRNGTLQRNFQGYSTWGNCDLIGLGVSAISQVGDVYSQNHSRIPDYQQALEAGCLPVARGYRGGPDDKLRRHIIRELSCQFRLDFAQVEQGFDVCFRDYFCSELRELDAMARQGFVDLFPDHLQVTDDGRLLVRQICSVFDSYLRTRPELAERHSRVI